MHRSVFYFGLLLSILSGTVTATGEAANPCHQYSPNIDGEVLLENDKLVVQSFVFPPEVWEGVHSHPAGQVYIHVKGGQWTVRCGESLETMRHRSAIKPPWPAWPRLGK